MTLRITASTRGGTTTIRIEGRLEAIGVRDLRAVCRSAGNPLLLDLSGLRSADEAGIEAIRSLRAEGAQLHGASPHVRQLLKQ